MAVVCFIFTTHILEASFTCKYDVTFLKFCSPISACLQENYFNSLNPRGKYVSPLLSKSVGLHFYLHVSCVSQRKQILFR